jgi:hypothetical protein
VVFARMIEEPILRDDRRYPTELSDCVPDADTPP